MPSKLKYPQFGRLEPGQKHLAAGIGGDYFDAVLALECLCHLLHGRTHKTINSPGSLCLSFFPQTVKSSYD